MFSKWKPVFSPETEVGNTEPAGDIAPPPESTPEPAERPSGPGSGRSELRKSLEEGFERARKAADPSEEQEEEQTAKRQSRKPPKGDRVGGRLDALPDSGSAPETTSPEQGEDTEEAGIPDSAPPDGWSAEAKAEWANAPDSVRAAVLKREHDMSKGVKSLQSKYAEFDKVLEPHMAAIQQHGHTPAAAVKQLFAWFDALGKNPAVAFPALARSFGYNIEQFVRAPNQQQQPQTQPPQQPPQAGQQPGTPTAPPGFDQKKFEQRYANYLNQQLQQRDQTWGQKMQQLEGLLQQQNQRKTEENLAVWSKDKPYYEDVRVHMAHLINSGDPAYVQDGNVNLDAVYEAAIWANTDIRNRMYQEEAAKARAAAKAQKVAEAKAQAEQAEKARKAATSVPISAPGVAPLAKAGERKKGKSVRENINEAIALARGD